MTAFDLLPLALIGLFAYWTIGYSLHHKRYDPRLPTAALIGTIMYYITTAFMYIVRIP